MFVLYRIQMIAKILNYIKSNNGIGTFAILSLFVMLAHTATVFENLSHIENWFKKLQAYMFAIAIDASILVFVLRGRTWLSTSFSIFQVVMNLLYYYDNAAMRKESGTAGDGINWIAAIFLSISLPIVIAAYSHEIAEGMKLDEDIRLKDIENNLKEEYERNLELKLLEEQSLDERFNDLYTRCNLLIEEVRTDLNKEKLNLDMKLDSKITKVIDSCESKCGLLDVELNSIKEELNKEVEVVATPGVDFSEYEKNIKDVIRKEISREVNTVQVSLSKSIKEVEDKLTKNISINSTKLKDLEKLEEVLMSKLTESLNDQIESNKKTFSRKIELDSVRDIAKVCAKSLLNLRNIFPAHQKELIQVENKHVL